MSRRTPSSRRAALKRPVLALSAVIGGVALAVSLTSAPGTAGATTAALPALSGAPTTYDVLVADGGSLAAAQKAVKANGGKIIRTNKAVGLISVTAPANGFAERMATVSEIDGAAPSRSVGRVPSAKSGKAARSRSAVVEKEGQAAAATSASARRTTQASPSAKAAAVSADPLDDRLWGMRDIHADQAHAVQPGDPRTLVGIIDTGVDGTHPDLAPNFSDDLSRNFTTDIPTDPNGAVVDGPCEFASCVDPVDEDDNEHGTHVAGTIGAALNGIGVSGVAPGVTLVNVRAGQDSGFFFLQPTVDAITYSGDAGLDVVNMSFYVDPWLYNCKSNPADSPAEQREQRIVIKAMKRALNYAFNHGVTLVSALGNEHTDLGNPLPDATSPDYPSGSAHSRTVQDSDCLSMPTEGPHVLGVSSYGPTLAKADYSNYGEQQITVAAPGGYFRDGFGTPSFRTLGNNILSTYPKKLGVTSGNIDPTTGDITPQGRLIGITKSCDAAGTTCGYYQYLQGTSMASPHAAGVAALIVSQYGAGSGAAFGLAPNVVGRTLAATAQETPCPTPATVSYINEGRDASYTATCTGTTAFNGFYGYGRVDALAAVTEGAKPPRGGVGVE